MKERYSYIGKLNGVFGIWCDQCPEDVEVEKTVTFYGPDEGKVFTKDGELFDSVVVDENSKIEDYVEIIDPRKTEESVEE